MRRLAKPRITAVAPVTAADVEDVVRMMGNLSRHQGDPAALFDADAFTANLLGQSPWLRGDVARVDGQAAGAVLWHTAYETSFAARGAYIVSLWVEPAFRRMRIATRLVAAVADRISREGGTFVWWASKPWNSVAHRTYASLGAGEEPVEAHALTGERFAAIARRGREARETT